MARISSTALALVLLLALGAACALADDVEVMKKHKKHDKHYEHEHDHDGGDGPHDGGEEPDGGDKPDDDTHSHETVKTLIIRGLLDTDFIEASGGSREAARTVGLFQYWVRCGNATLASPRIGWCAETNIYLSNSAGAPLMAGVQPTNIQSTCVFTAPCGGFGPGTIEFGGTVPGGSWAGLGPIKMSVWGGTGAFADIIRGQYLYNSADDLSRFTLVMAK